MAHAYAQPTTWDANERAVRLAWEASPAGREAARRAAFIEQRTDTYLTEELRGQHERVNAAMADLAPIIDRLAGEEGVGREFGFGCRDRLRAIDTGAAKRRAKARAELLASRMDFTIHPEAAQ